MLTQSPVKSSTVKNQGGFYTTTPIIKPGHYPETPSALCFEHLQNNSLKNLVILKQFYRFATGILEKKEHASFAPGNIQGNDQAVSTALAANTTALIIDMTTLLTYIVALTTDTIALTFD